MGKGKPDVEPDNEIDIAVGVTGGLNVCLLINDRTTGTLHTFYLPLGAAMSLTVGLTGATESINARIANGEEADRD